MLCVYKINPTSPRFKYFADNWHVLEKIQRAIADNTFDNSTMNCPAYHAEELRAALDYLNDSDTVEKPIQTTLVNKLPNKLPHKQPTQKKRVKL